MKQLDLLPPVHRNPDESERLAAAKVAPAAKGLRFLVLQFIAAHPEGVIPDQVCQRFPDLEPYTLRPRFAELARAGLIRKSLEMRPNRRGNPERVWVAV